MSYLFGSFFFAVYAQVKRSAIATRVDFKESCKSCLVSLQDCDIQSGLAEFVCLFPRARFPVKPKRKHRVGDDKTQCTSD